MAKYYITPATHELDFHIPEPSAPHSKQEAYLELDIEDGELQVNTYASGSGISERAWHGIVRCYELPFNVDAIALTKAINEGEFDTLFDSVISDSEVLWDGNNWKGLLSASASDAENAILVKLENYTYQGDEPYGIWSAADWLYDVRFDLGITADSTNAELEAIANKQEQEALDRNVKLCGTMNRIKQFRKFLIDERDLQAEEAD